MSIDRKQMTDLRIGAFNIRHVRRLDWILLILVGALAAIGILTLYSANRSASVTPPYYTKQMIFFFGGLLVALVVACMDHRFLLSLAPLGFTALVGLLVAVSFVGETHKGATRWLNLGFAEIQPSEQSKLALIFMLAWFLSIIGRGIEKLPYFILTLLIAAIPSLLILRQPNLGTAATLGPIVFAMLWVAGCKRWHLLAVILAGLVAAPLGWTQMTDYQRGRVMPFIEPESVDPEGAGWHTTQSMITVGSGGLNGKGYLKGTQTYLSYLPEHHTDFIFSHLAEDWGFMGSTVVIGVFGLFLLRGLSLAQSSPDLAGALLATGIVTLLGFHVFINIGITAGMMPVTGIPLPFLSYGGSFYLTTMLCVGVLLSIHVRKKVMRQYQT